MPATVRLTRLLAAVVLGLLAASLGACSSTPKSERLAPQTMAPTPPPQPEAPEEPDGREVQPTTPPEQPETDLTVVIEEHEVGQTGGRSLVEAAAAERKRRETAGESIAVITDKNLKDFTEGQLTEVAGSQSDTGRDPSSEPSSASGLATAQSPDPETYWRTRIRRARRSWAATVEEIGHLEDQIAELRQRFYAEDDPYYRDSQIKPSWDRALDRLAETRTAAEERRLEVQNILEEGRRASALPGWLREGIELEPDELEGEPEAGPSPPGEHLPGEPKVAADPDGARR